jgi:hypothetical protein
VAWFGVAVVCDAVLGPAALMATTLSAGAGGSASSGKTAPTVGATQAPAVADRHAGAGTSTTGSASPAESVPELWTPRAAVVL